MSSSSFCESCCSTSRPHTSSHSLLEAPLPSHHWLLGELCSRRRPLLELDTRELGEKGLSFYSTSMKHLPHKHPFKSAILKENSIKLLLFSIQAAQHYKANHETYIYLFTTWLQFTQPEVSRHWCGASLGSAGSLTRPEMPLAKSWSLSPGIQMQTCWTLVSVESQLCFLFDLLSPASDWLLMNCWTVFPPLNSKKMFAFCADE